MKSGYCFTVALAMAACIGGLATPAQAEDDYKGDKSPNSFVNKLTKAADEAVRKAEDNESLGKDDSKSTSSKSQDKTSAKTKTAEKETSLSQLVKSSDSKTKAIKGKQVLVLGISGNVEERGQDVVLFGSQPESLKRYVDTLRRARLDDSIKSVVLRIGPNTLGMATAQELREAITELRKRDKHVTAVIEDDSQASYLVAIAANEVVMPPSADLMLHGVSADSYFLRDLLNKVGVKVQIIHIGQYKSYGETYTHDDFTTPAKQNMTEIVDDVYGQIKTMIADSRKVTPEQAEAAIDAGPISADEALKLKLIDRVAYADEVLDGLKKEKLEILDSDDYKIGKKSSSSSDVSLLGILGMLSKSDDSDSSDNDLPRVGILYAVGEISLGSSGGSGFGSTTEIASQDFIDELEKLKEDDKIKAVILRVNSPGGSAFASDLIWKKIEELKKKKPVVASMGDVAASGGYYISMGANKIIAQPGTVTGSIGVVGGKPNLKGLYEKLGVNKTTISKGRYSGLFSETTDFSTDEEKVVQGMMKHTYDDFVNKAARGRNQTYDKINEVAQGRVWTGSRAKEVGLVDELGGLDKAIVETKALIGLKSDDKVRLIAYPKEQTLMDVLQKTFGVSSSTVHSGVPAMSILMDALPVPAPLAGVMKNALRISSMFQQESVLAVMPFTIHLH